MNVTECLVNVTSYGMATITTLNLILNSVKLNCYIKLMVLVFLDILYYHMYNCMIYYFQGDFEDKQWL